MGCSSSNRPMVPSCAVKPAPTHLTPPLPTPSFPTPHRVHRFVSPGHSQHTSCQLTTIPESASREVQPVTPSVIQHCARYSNMEKQRPGAQASDKSSNSQDVTSETSDKSSNSQGSIRVVPRWRRAQGYLGYRGEL